MFSVGYVKLVGSILSIDRKNRGDGGSTTTPEEKKGETEGVAFVGIGIVAKCVVDDVIVVTVEADLATPAVEAEVALKSVTNSGLQVSVGRMETCLAKLKEESIMLAQDWEVPFELLLLSNFPKNCSEKFVASYIEDEGSWGK